jgi:hypothetical protein
VREDVSSLVTNALPYGWASASAEITMSANQSDETPANITTDAESQEYGAQHGQNVEGQDTGSSAPDASAAEEGEGAGAHS